MSKEVRLTKLEFSLWDEAIIHVKNQIQPHGTLLVLEAPELEIFPVSTNTLFFKKTAPMTTDF